MSDHDKHSTPIENERKTSEENEHPENSTTSPTTPYKPRAEEVAVAKKYFARKNAQTAPRLKVIKSPEGISVEYDHPHPGLADALFKHGLGTVDDELANGLFRQLGPATSVGGEASEDELNFAFSVVRGIEPRDPMETLLGSQMATIHAAAMQAAKRLQTAPNPAAQEAAERMLNRLTRTFAAQMEALKRYRSGGGQSVTVQNVSVSDGGQAIVGNVTQSARPGGSETAPSPVANSGGEPKPIGEDGEKHAPRPAKPDSSE